MSCYVRLLSPSEETLPFSEIQQQGNYILLSEGTEHSWKKIKIYEPRDNLIAVLERHSIFDDSLEESLVKLNDSIRSSYPVSAREWIRNYLSRVKTIYSFQLSGNNITREGWPALGRIQNYLKDSLSGIIQADNEGFFNENGDYILWQMYTGARGSIPAATLDENGEWVPYQLKLDDKSIEQFKQGELPKKGFLSRLLGG